VDCARCETKICHGGTDCTGEGSEDEGAYEGEDRRIFEAAAAVEAEGYCKLCRVEELILFGRKLGIRRLGLAFCVGLSEEARLLDEVLGRSFEVTSVCCKVCALSKDELNLPRIRPERERQSGGVGGRIRQHESGCNPAGQARVLAEARTELNIIVGLCIGHDILFTRRSAAPVTTLVVKDRVLGHNPVAAIHSSYHRRRLG
jgi:uncharacterized metal-binding protein